jgi:hypothetical protein
MFPRGQISIHVVELFSRWKFFLRVSLPDPKITHAGAEGKYGSVIPPVMCFHKKLPDSKHPMSGTEAAPTTKSSFIHEGGVIEGIQFAGVEASHSADMGQHM